MVQQTLVSVKLPSIQSLKLLHLILNIEFLEPRNSQNKVGPRLKFSKSKSKKMVFSMVFKAPHSNSCLLIGSWTGRMFKGKKMVVLPSLLHPHLRDGRVWRLCPQGPQVHILQRGEISFRGEGCVYPVYLFPKFVTQERVR